LKKIAVTGCRGFIGQNLVRRLEELGFEIGRISHDDDDVSVRAALAGSCAVFHLAGVNRPTDEVEFQSGNVGMTQRLIGLFREDQMRLPVIYASSIQAERNNSYGRSKRQAEELVAAFGREQMTAVHIFRLPNVFGKWAKPNYNSVVATFCYNLARDLPIVVNDPEAPLRLVYIDDVVDAFIALLDDAESAVRDGVVKPEYVTTVGYVAALIQSFRDSRRTLLTDAVGSGLIRALHATYLSYLPPAEFSYTLKSNTDPRGAFVEVLRTVNCGQFSYFTAHPGVTRGGHYHHTKTEKFLVVQGKARFGFRHILTGERFEVFASGSEPMVVETVPGWVHDVTNIGDQMMIVLLWANELFDQSRPDTIAAKV